jgi:hypothetical protein
LASHLAGNSVAQMGTKTEHLTEHSWAYMMVLQKEHHSDSSTAAMWVDQRVQWLVDW